MIIKLLIIKYFLRFLSFGSINPLESMVFFSGINFDACKITFHGVFSHLIKMSQKVVFMIRTLPMSDMYFNRLWILFSIILKIRFYLLFLKVPMVHKGKNEVRGEEKKPLTEWGP